MKYINVSALLLMTIVYISCGEKQTNSPKENINSEPKDTIPSYRSNDPDIHTRYVYADSVNNHMIIKNSFPRGDKYIAPDGEEYFKVIFWSEIINQTDNPLELNISFPIDMYEHPSSPGKYFKILVPADTMTHDKIHLFNYGMTDLKSFLNKNIHKAPSLKRTINPKDSSGVYIVMLSLRVEGATGMFRTGLTLKGQDLFYKISRYTSRAPISLIDEKEIHCGSITLKNLVLGK